MKLIGLSLGLLSMRRAIAASLAVYGNDHSTSVAIAPSESDTGNPSAVYSLFHYLFHLLIMSRARNLDYVTFFKINLIEFSSRFVWSDSHQFLFQFLDNLFHTAVHYSSLDECHLIVQVFKNRTWR